MSGFHRYAAALSMLILAPSVAASQGAAPMRKVHVSAPEAEVFLRLAAESLADYRARRGAYPTAWSELDMTYVNGPYNIRDPDDRPPPDAKDVWRPKQSNYEYRLTTSADGSAFRIDALGTHGEIDYSIRSGDPYPIKAE
jgi:hypothetical protein